MGVVSRTKLVPGFELEADGSSQCKENAGEFAGRLNRRVGKDGGESAWRCEFVPQRRRAVKRNANRRSKRVSVTNDAKKGFMAFSRNESNSGLTQKPLRFVKPDKLFLVSGNKIPHLTHHCRRTQSGANGVDKVLG